MRWLRGRQKIAARLVPFPDQGTGVVCTRIDSSRGDWDNLGSLLCMGSRGDFPRKLLKCPQDGVLQPEESMPIRAAKHQSWTFRCERRTIDPCAAPRRNFRPPSPRWSRFGQASPACAGARRTCGRRPRTVALRRSAAGRCEVPARLFTSHRKVLNTPRRGRNAGAETQVAGWAKRGGV